MVDVFVLDSLGSKCRWLRRPDTTGVMTGRLLWTTLPDVTLVRQIRVKRGRRLHHTTLAICTSSYLPNDTEQELFCMSRTRNTWSNTRFLSMRTEEGALGFPYLDSEVQLPPRPVHVCQRSHRVDTCLAGSLPREGVLFLAQANLDLGDDGPMRVSFESLRYRSDILVWMVIKSDGTRWLGDHTPSLIPAAHLSDSSFDQHFITSGCVVLATS